MKKWTSRAAILLIVLTIISFGIRSAKSCPDGSRVETYLAITVLADLTGTDLCHP